MTLPDLPPPAVGGLDYSLRQCRHGLFLLNRKDRFIGGVLDRYGEFSEAELQLLLQLIRPGATVLDVGANIGAHTVPLARHVGPAGAVVAFEPQRLVFQMLCANVALNRLTNVTTRWAAVGAEGGTVTMPAVDYARRGNFGGVSIGAGPMEPGRGEPGRGEPVALLRIDDLDLPRCDLMKIDVEGFELEVLKGAAGTLRRLKPRLYVENDREEKSPALIRHLLDLGYRLYWSLPSLLDPRELAAAEPALRIVSVNMLCIPPGDGVAVQGGLAIVDPDADWRQALPRAAATPRSP